MQDDTPAVAILPHDRKLGGRPGRLPLDLLWWPLGRPDRLNGTDKTLRHLAREDHLIVFPRDTLHFRPGFGTNARLSLFVLEPRAIHGHHMRLLRWTHRRFYRILNYNEEFLSSIPNGVFFPFGSSWISDWRRLDRQKTRACSLIASGKRSQQGHLLRHELAEWAQHEGLDIDVMGRGYKPFASKAQGLAPYRFSLVIENVRERNYFTEKLIDAVLCRTVPIYWGCPNIGDFMDTSGMILCETGEDMRRAVGDMSDARYQALLPGLEAAIASAEHYGDWLGRAARAVLDGGQAAGGHIP